MKCLTHDPVFEPETLSGDIDDIGVVEEPVEDRSSRRHITDELAPFFDGAILPGRTNRKNWTAASAHGRIWSRLERRHKANHKREWKETGKCARQGQDS